MLKKVLTKHLPAKKCPGKIFLQIFSFSFYPLQNFSVINVATEEHCPLCNKNIPAGEESWKVHLMGSKRDACAENSRRIPHIKQCQ